MHAGSAASRNDGNRGGARPGGPGNQGTSAGEVRVPLSRSNPQAPAAPKTHEQDPQGAQGEEEWSEGDMEAGEEEEAQRQCILCGKVPSSIICLVCNHCVDIPCAAQLIIGEGDPQKIDLGSITCPECSQTTTLSQEVQQTILEYFESEELQFEGQGDEEQHYEEEMQYQEENAEFAENEGEDGHIPSDQGAKQSKIATEMENSNDQAFEAQEQGHRFSSMKTQKIRASGTPSHQGTHHSQKLSNNGNTQIQGPIRSEANTHPKRVASGSSQAKRSRANQSESDSTHPAQSQSGTDISLHFACLDHPNEEYAFYSTTERKLYCPSCLITSSGPAHLRNAQPSGLKPLKKSIP